MPSIARYNRLKTILIPERIDFPLPYPSILGSNKALKIDLGVCVTAKYFLRIHCPILYEQESLEQKVVLLHRKLKCLIND